MPTALTATLAAQFQKPEQAEKFMDDLEAFLEAQRKALGNPGIKAEAHTSRTESAHRTL